MLGGAGECGRHVVEALAAAEEIERIVVADADLDAARALVERLGAPGLEAVELDVADAGALVGAAAAVDCLVNCTPFPLFDRVIAAAIEARVDYVDLISEPSLEQRRRAAAAGIVAISGVGMSPGTTNVLCAHAASALDRLDEFYVNFATFRTIAPSPGLLDTILWELGDDCRTRFQFQEGRYLRRASQEGSHLVSFPEPVGAQRVYVMPHPETNTLPRSFPDLRHVAVRGTWNPHLMADIAVLNRYGLLDDTPLGDGLPTAFDATKQRIWQKFGGQRRTWPEWTLFVVIEAIGELDGAMVERRYQVWHEPWGTEGTGRMTGLQAAVGVRLLARHGRTRGVGFVDPERYFDPQEYLPEIEAIPGLSLSWSDTELAAPVDQRAKQPQT